MIQVVAMKINIFFSCKCHEKDHKVCMNPALCVPCVFEESLQISPGNSKSEVIAFSEKAGIFTEKVTLKVYKFSCLLNEGNGAVGIQLIDLSY